ncbi:MAG: hypothetical protein ACT4OM_08930 [Actinomycetota bacterium]
MEHVLIRKLEHLAGTRLTPKLGFAVEIRDRPGPVFKSGAFQDDEIWVQLHGGLYVARAKIKLAWLGEYSAISEVRDRTKGSSLHDMASFWSSRPKWGYAAVASLKSEAWLPPFWAGPRTYGYEWVLLADDGKRASWLNQKDPPRSSDDLRGRFDSWLKTR